MTSLTKAEEKLVLKDKIDVIKLQDLIGYREVDTSKFSGNSLSKFAAGLYLNMVDIYQFIGRMEINKTAKPDRGAFKYKLDSVNARLNILEAIQQLEYGGQQMNKKVRRDVV